jgi:hypothetical protein
MRRPPNRCPDMIMSSDRDKWWCHVNVVLSPVKSNPLKLVPIPRVTWIRCLDAAVRQSLYQDIAFRLRGYSQLKQPCTRHRQPSYDRRNLAYLLPKFVHASIPIPCLLPSCCLQYRTGHLPLLTRCTTWRCRSVLVYWLSRFTTEDDDEPLPVGPHCQL